MYSIVRFFIEMLLILIAFIIGRQCFRNSKPKQITVYVVTFFIMLIAYLVPFENWFYTFPSVDKAYTYIANDTIQVIVEGESSAFVLASNERGKTAHIHVFSKDKDGWKLCNGFDVKQIKTSFINECSLQVYRYKNSEDYYVIISDRYYKKLQLNDTYKTVFIESTLNGQNGLYEYCGYIKNWTIPYKIDSSGMPIVFE